MSDPGASDYFRSLMAAAPDALLVIDAAGVIVLANAAAHRLFGYLSGELEGHSVETLVPKRFRHAHAEAREAFDLEGRPRRMGERGQLLGVRRDGSEFHADISLGRCDVGEAAFTLASVRDLTGQDRLIEERESLRSDLLEARLRLRELERRVEACPRCGAHPGGEDPAPGESG